MKQLRCIIALICALLSAPAFAQTNQGSSPLTGPKGGTNNAFMQFAGPASTLKTFTLPNASDTIVLLTQSQTLTNKTLNCANNTCTVRIGSDVSGLGTGVASWLATPSSANLAAAITDETGSGALVFGTTPTLTTPVLGVATATSINKVAITAPATSATLTIPDGVTLIGPASSGTAMTLGNTETVTGIKTFGSASAVGRLKIAGTTSGSTTLDASATASGTLTLPAATDTLVGRATTDTLTNKTLTSPVISSISNSGTLTLPTSTDTLVGRATTDTLTNKTLTAPVISTITNSGTLTLPTSTDTLVGRATTDTLTNKTFNTQGTGNVFTLNGAAFGTATQATAALNAVVGDSGSGGTKGLVPAPGAGDASAAKFLKADGTWAVPAGGGGGSGATDTERQNSLLGLIYQSKSFAGARRLVNLFADGFKATDGVNAGSSSSYAVTTASGYVAATVASLSYTNSATVSGTLSFGPNYTYVNRQTAITNGVTVCYLGISLASAETVTLKIIQRDSSTQNDVVFSQSFSHPGGGYADMTMSSCYTVPGSGTYYPAVWFNSSASRTATVSGGRSYYNGDPAVQNNLTGWTDDTAAGPALRWAPAGVPDNMTVVTATQTADSSVSYGRVLLEYDNSATPTLNTDLTVEVTTNGGTNWAAATLSAVTSYSQGGRKVAETADTSTTSGTSFAARIKTFNNKDIKVYGATLTVR